jgi:GntR family transcriptional regulator
MNFRVNPAGGEPVYQQLVWQVKRAVARGDLLPDERLPSVRELAAQLLINPNTIARAYREMEREGLVYTQPGRGVFVRADCPAELTEAARDRILGELIERVVVEARLLGVPKDQLTGLFGTLVAQFGVTGAESGSKELPGGSNERDAT